MSGEGPWAGDASEPGAPGIITPPCSWGVTLAWGVCCDICWDWFWVGGVVGLS